MINKSEKINELASALSKAQGEIKDVVKEKTGYGYKYADLQQIIDMLRPILLRHGLALVQMPSNINESDSSIALTTMLIHTSGQFIEDKVSVPVQIGKGMSATQAVGSALTYARRYVLSAMFMIAQADNDAAIKPTGNEIVGIVSTKLTPAQAGVIEKLISESGADKKLFLEWAGCKSVSDVHPNMYGDAIKILEAKKAKKAA